MSEADLSERAIADARALLAALVATGWTDIHIATQGIEIFIATVAGRQNPMAVPDPIASYQDLQVILAPHVATLVEVADAGLSADMVAAAAIGITLSFVLPLPAFWVLRRFAGLGRIDAGAVAAHYGSVSVVTFVTGVEVLSARGLPPAGYMVAVLALMETPAIVTGLLLARRGGTVGGNGGELAREVLANGSVLLLVGSFVIGMLIGHDRFKAIAPVFDAGFKGVLCLFLLDMGLVAARRLMDGRLLTLPLVGLAIALPVVNGSLGVALGVAAGLDTGTAAALGILAGSASYIAVPAAMRLALPEADPGRYLAMSLGVSFPFNILIGIPLFTAIAQGLSG